MSDWKNCISQSVGSERINNLNDYVVTRPPTDSSPIDQFYGEMQTILRTFPQQILTESSWVGALALIAVVSSIENYFRQLFSQTLKLCVDSQKRSAGKNVNLGSVIWHPSHEIERGAFEHMSLASAENISTTAKKYFDIDFKSNGNGLATLLEEFDKICELRHGAVHSGRVLAGKNGIKLKLAPTTNITLIDIGFAELQEVMAVCNALVVESNRLFFIELGSRWATSWRRTPGWNNSDSNSKFRDIWQMLHSSRDQENGTIPQAMSWIKCRNQIKRDFNV